MLHTILRRALGSSSRASCLAIAGSQAHCFLGYTTEAQLRDQEDSSTVETRQAWRPSGPQVPQANLGTSEAPPHTSSTTGSSVATGSVTPAFNDHPMVDEVVSLLATMGLEPGRDCVVGDGLVTIDVGLMVQGIQIAIELDVTSQPGLVMTNPRQYAQMRARQQMLQSLGWSVVHLSTSQWVALQSEHDKMHFLIELLKGALGRGPGRHQHTHSRDHSHGEGGGCCGGGGSHEQHQHQQGDGEQNHNDHQHQHLVNDGSGAPGKGGGCCGGH